MDKTTLTHRFARGLHLLVIAALLVGLAMGLRPVPRALAFAMAATMTVNSSADYTVKENGPSVFYSSANAGPEISLNRSRLNYGAVQGGACTRPQPFLINNSGTGALNWTVSTDRSWISANLSSGVGSDMVIVAVNPWGLAVGAYTGTVSVSDPDASNSPQTIEVHLNVYTSTNPPFGEFSTPVDGSTVRGSIPVTGWALDDIGVESVKIYRETNGGLSYINDAAFVEGARPDVEAAYPGYPKNYQAGWSYMLVTHFLPNGGNGTYTLRAVATDAEGNEVTLGTKTITCDNANAVKPFGDIDTPRQGDMAYGSHFRVQGWALTPQPNSIPTDGSTISVYVDGVNLGHPVYNIYRANIAALFPGYANSNGAGWYFDLDTTIYANGVHTIQAVVTDNAGNTDGIGARYFSMLNVTPRLTVNKVGTGMGMVISEPAGISCGADCTEIYDQGTVVTLRAYPGVKSYVKWSGDCDADGQVTMLASKVCIATFGYPVGGIVVPVDKLGLVAPWIGLAAVVMVGAVVAIVLRRRTSVQT